MSKDRMVVAMDIGTSKVTILVGEIDDVGDLHIVAFGESKSKGIEKGIIIRPSDAIRSIKEAIDMAESTAGSKITSVIANVGGYHLECRNDSEKTDFGMSQKTITQNDIDDLIEKVASKLPRENYEIIHIIPKKYILDEEDEIVDPVGLVGSKIEGKFHIILDKINAYTNLKKVIESSGVRVANFVANPVAAASAVLYPEEKDMGIVVLDIGAGTTDMAVYREGSIDHIRSFPVGGNHVTMDIAHRFKVSKEEAENLKIEYGGAIADLSENNIIEVFPRGSEEPIQIEQFELVDTIEARLSEIFEIVKNELEETGFINKINGGIVLTGGVSNTPDIKELAENILGMDVRIGKPKDYKGFSDKIAFPQYATAIGMLLFTKSNSQKQSLTSAEANSELDVFGMFKSFVEKLKNLF
ncbi:cell division protein FtsA [Persephonella sp.]